MSFEPFSAADNLFHSLLREAIWRHSAPVAFGFFFLKKKKQTARESQLKKKLNSETVPTFYVLKKNETKIFSKALKFYREVEMRLGATFRLGKLLVKKRC